MNIRDSRFAVLAAVSAATLICGIQHTHAISMSTRLQSIGQSGQSAGVNVGHTVIASSPMNRLNAVGAFVASCAASHTGSISDQRGLPASALLGGTQLVVTVPAWLPAVRIMPGFEFTPAGTTLTCTYNWTSEAEESSYTIGAFGVGMTIGGEKAREGSSVPFQMHMPGGDDDSNNGCIH
jgi:hypothetical protein